MEPEPISEQKHLPAEPSPLTARTSCWSAVRRWILLAGYAYVAWISAVRLVTTITAWYWLNFAKVNPGPLYLAITGGVWCIVALAALIWILLRRPWHRLVGFAAALFFALTYWIDRLFVSTNPDGTGNTIFAVFLTLILLAYAFFILRPLPDLHNLASK